jgi:hypothetical protein
MKRVGKLTPAVWAALFILAGASAVGYAQQKPGSGPQPELSFEERIIRIAYAKLMTFSKVARLRKVEDEQAARRPDEDLRFEIRNVKSGPVEEILDQPWSDRVTGRSGEVLSVVPGQTSHGQGPAHAYYLAEWVDAGHSSRTGFSETVRDVLNSQPEYIDVGKYTSYEVTVHFEGRQRSYRAMVIYHQPLQSAEKTRIEFLDNVVGSYAVGEALAEQNPPMRFPWNRYVRSQAYERAGSGPRAAIVRPRGAEDRADARQETGAFSLDGEMASSEEREGVVSKGAASKGQQWNFGVGDLCDGWGGMCCDWNMNTCCYPYDPNTGICDNLTCEFPNCSSPPPVDGWGGGGEEQGCTANTARGGVAEKSFEDFQQHVFVGYITRHTGWAKFRPKCVIGTDCSASCYVNLYGSPSYGWYDDGPGTTSDGRYHVVRIKTDDRSGGTTVRGERVSCTAAVAMAFKSCTDQTCGFQISLTLGPTGWHAISDGFFETVMQHGWECQAPQ